MNYSIREDEGTRFEYCRYGRLTVSFVGATKYSVRKTFLYIRPLTVRKMVGKTKPK